MIKNIIKQTRIGRIISQARRERKKKKMVNVPISEYEKRFLKNSCALKSNDSPENLRLRIIVESHVIEKGLSHNDYRPGFGKQNMVALCEHLFQYTRCSDIDTFAIDNAVSLLMQYHERNKEFSFDDSDYIPIDEIKPLIKHRVYEAVSCGVKPINIGNVKKSSRKFNFEEFEHLRSSVRVFDTPCKPIDEKILGEVVDIAKFAPSACNRQAVRVHFVTARHFFPEIEKLQRGSTGFLRNCSAVAVITAELSLYEASEYKLPIFDAGLFTMNLCYTFESKGYFSCILNGYFSETDDQKLRKIVEMKTTEEIISIVAIYNIDDDQVLSVPISPRRDGIELYSIQSS